RQAAWPTRSRGDASARSGRQYTGTHHSRRTGSGQYAHRRCVAPRRAGGGRQRNQGNCRADRCSARARVRVRSRVTGLIMAALEILRVTKQFAKHRAVDDITLSVTSGEFLVLLGPSGCGKSTLLRMVAGLEMPNFGEIRIGTRDVTRLQPRDRNVAMVFQNYALYPHLTVFENIAFPLRSRH